MGLTLEDGTLARDEHGLWHRDLLSLPLEDIQAGLQHVWHFFEGKHNCNLEGTDAAKIHLRLIDSHNFAASDRVRYVDENKAARLAQMQRFLGDFTAGHCLRVLFCAHDGEATISSTPIRCRAREESCLPFGMAH